MKEEIKEDPYNGQFINGEKMELVMRDILVVLEKWKLRQLEKEIVILEAQIYLTQMKANEINKSRETDANSFINGWFKKIGLNPNDE